jgi:hypothetical protein
LADVGEMVEFGEELGRSGTSFDALRGRMQEIGGCRFDALAALAAL